MGLDDEIEEKLAGKFLKLFFRESTEHIIELGIWGLILKFSFGLTIKTAIVTTLIIVILSIMKKAYYKEDLYLAFAILFLFEDYWWLGYFLFIYLSYFRGIYGLFNPEKRKSEKYSKFKSVALAVIGQYIAPILLLVIARKFKELKDKLFFLIGIAFIHQLNYYFLLMIDIIANKKKYSKKETKAILMSALKDTRLNLLITIILLALVKHFIFTYAYTDASWGVLDKFFETLGWII
jgi:hypothetical protein